MIQVMILGFLFVGTHFWLSSAALRTPLVDRFGENGFLGVYSLVSAVTLVLLILAYGEASRVRYWWYPDPTQYAVAKVIMWFAVVLVAGSFLAPNPSSVGMGDKAKEGPHGMLRVTRHPLLLGVGLWGFAHIVANGDLVSVVFFSWFVVLAVLGALLLDAKKGQQLGSDWHNFSAQTSLLPFRAILAGRTKLVVAELVAPVVVGSLVYGLLFWAHEWLSGVELTLF